MAQTMSVGEQLAEILEDYSKEVKETTEKVLKSVSKESAQKLKNSSPKRTGEYAKSWSVKTEKDGSFIVHNTKHFQLTHLLENGHVIRNKKGTYGRTNGIKHIAPVEEWANSEVVNRITREL